MSPNVAIARLWCPLGMLLACVVKLGDLRCAGPVRQRSWRASLCLKKRGTRGVSESGGPMQFISEKFGFWSLARRLTVGAVAQAQRPLPGCIHYTLHAWAAEWGECVRVAEALKSRLPRCVPPCLVAFLVAIQLGVCVGRTWWITALNKWWFSIAMLVYQSVLVQSNRFYLLVIKHSNWMQFAIPKCPINGGLQLGKLSIHGWFDIAIYYQRAIVKTVDFPLQIWHSTPWFCRDKTNRNVPGISGLHPTPQVHWGLNWPKKSGFKWLLSIIVAIIYHELPLVGWSNPGIYLPKLGIATSTISARTNSETEQLINQRVPNQRVPIAILWGYQFLKT